MKRQSILRLNRRKLLTGIAATVTAAVIAPHASSSSDRIVMREGWFLKESDLA